MWAQIVCKNTVKWMVTLMVGEVTRLFRTAPACLGRLPACLGRLPACLGQLPACLGRLPACYASKSAGPMGCRHRLYVKTQSNGMVPSNYASKIRFRVIMLVLASKRAGFY